MKQLCTLSDKNYLLQGIALYFSLLKFSKDTFELHYLCLDEESYKILTYNNFPNLKPVLIDDVLKEKEDLRKHKERCQPELGGGNNNEFCWSLASYFSDYLLNKGLDSILYIDSDIAFYRDIQLVYDEIGDKSIGIIRHRHLVEESVDGLFNVGIVYFKGDETGKKCLHWWKDAVMHKRYPEMATCGDQKYLEGFFGRFGEENIQIIDKEIGHGAPWQYRFYVWDLLLKTGDIVWGRKKQPFVFNHFSRFKYDLEQNNYDYTSGNYADHTFNFNLFMIPQLQVLYQNYFETLKQMHEQYVKPVKL